ncbi:MAG: PEP-CTERM sorting domain-containing protein [Planctomycetes bacterium]|jgi:hypothetical protein|nr:PEP-CTERM sorting domain-containing protein [Planctomycetota bacterium]
MIGKATLAAATLMVCSVFAASTAMAGPVITIGGLDGAEHWTWIEAEDAIGGTGSTGVYNSLSISGAPNNADYYSQETSIGSGNVQLTFAAPVNMSADTKIYMRASIERSRRIAFSVDGGAAVSDHMAIQPSGSLPSQFLVQSVNGSNPGSAAVNLGVVSQGEHTLTVTKGDSLTLNWWRFDGFLIYDGTPVLPTAPVDLGIGRVWLPNPTSAASPVITGSVTPTFDISGLAEGNRVGYLLDGEAYTPGTKISAGDHQLVVYVLENVSDSSDRIAFSGANFTVVPEPATIGLLVAGGCLLAARNKR